MTKKVKIVLLDATGQLDAQGEFDAQRIANAGAIHWIDTYYTFQRISGDTIYFQPVDILALDDEEVEAISRG